MQNDLTRPIIGVENRTAQEVFDIMCDRFRHLSATVPAGDGELVERYKAEAADALRMYNDEVEAHGKLEANLIRLSDKDRQLLRMIIPSIDQRSREPMDAWNQAAAVLWLLVDTTDPIAAFGPALAASRPSQGTGDIERAFKDGVHYATIVDVPNTEEARDEAWRCSKVRALSGDTL